MVKSILKIALVVCAFVSFQQLRAQRIKEGMVSFVIRYENLTGEMKEQQDYLPTNMYILFKEDKSRIEIKTVMGPMVTLSDSKQKISYVLTEMFGKKMAMKVTPEGAKKAADQMKKSNMIGEKKLVLTNETKKIAGYTCKKALVKTTIEGKPAELICYYTNELAPVMNDTYNNGYDLNIDGFVMEYSLVQNGVTMIFTAEKVEAKTVSDESFVVPAGYQIVDQFGGM